jgi:hypothetical protein
MRMHRSLAAVTLCLLKSWPWPHAPQVGAGSVVVSDLPPHCVAVGVPATIVKRNIRAEPVKEMDQCTDFILDYTI